MRRAKISLKSFLVSTLVVGAIVGLSLRYFLSTEEHFGRYCSEPCPWQAMWRKSASGNELLYIVFFPGNRKPAIFSVGWIGSPVRGVGVECHPEGLFYEGATIETTKTRRVFVFTHENKMRPIELTKDELKLLSSNKIDTLPNTDLWKQKILPIVIEEEGELVRVQ